MTTDACAVCGDHWSDLLDHGCTSCVSSGPMPSSYADTCRACGDGGTYTLAVGRHVNTYACHCTAGRHLDACRECAGSGGEWVETFDGLDWDGMPTERVTWVACACKNKAAGTEALAA